MSLYKQHFSSRIIERRRETLRCVPWKHAIVLATMALGLIGPVQGQIPEVQYNLLEVTTAQTALRTLQQPKRFLWDGQPLREGVYSLAQANQLNVWIDRRIDPGQLVSYAPPSNADASGRESTLLGRMQLAAKEIHAEVGLVENVIYVGPAGETERIQAAVVRLHDAISKRNAKLGSEARLLKWSELTTPQSLLQVIEKQWGIDLQGELSHDLLHAGELQVPSTLATQLMLVVGGFGLQAEVVGDRSFQLEPLESESRWRANYAKDSLNPAVYSEVRRRYAGSQMQCRANTCSLVGLTSFHIDMFAIQRKPRNGTSSKPRMWSLDNDPAPTQRILESVAAGIGVALQWDPACTEEHRSKLQAIKLVQVTTDELLTQVCSGAGLDYSLEDEKLIVRPQSR